MNKATINAVLGAATFLMATENMPAQGTANTGTAPPPTSWEEWVKKTKNPTDWFTWGGDLRVRDEYMPNTVTLTEDDPLSNQNVIRFRGRLWATATPIENFSLNARLSAEPRYFTEPAGFGPYGPSAVAAGSTPREGMEWRYGILDNLNFKWSNIADQPLTLTVGRQDILLGDYYDWWLVSDGTPGDGSWTFFLDSARLVYEAKPIQTRFDLAYIYQNAQADAWLPTLGRPRYEDEPRYPGHDHPLTEQDEQGVIVYASNKSIENLTLDGYFIYKRDEQTSLERRGVDREPSDPLNPGDNADIYTVGGKVAGTPAEHWSYSLEGAYQFGQKEEAINDGRGFADRDIEAYGGKARLSYLMKDDLNNQFSLVGEFLSGDDPSTPNQDEMFDVLWGRWPRWSELYIYSYAPETSGKIAQLNNLIRFGPSWSFSPMKGMTFSAMYNAMFAPEDTPTRRVPPAASLFSYDGNFRGHYLQTTLKHQFNKHIQAHLWGEFVWEGDFYEQRDLMTFLRAEIMLTF